MPVIFLSYIDKIRYSGYSRATKNYHILVTVAFKDLESAEEVNKSIRKLKGHVISVFEEGSTATTEEKKTILKKISLLKFKYRAVVIDGEWLRNEPFAHPDVTIFMLITNQLFLRNPKRFNNASLFIDKEDKPFINHYNKYLQKKLDMDLKQLIGPLRIADSRKNNLILLTDLICRVLYHKYDKQDDSLYRILKKREDDLWKPY